MSSLGTGEIVGIVFGGVAAIIGLAVALFTWKRGLISKTILVHEPSDPHGIYPSSMRPPSFRYPSVPSIRNPSLPSIRSPSIASPEYPVQVSKPEYDNTGTARSQFLSALGAQSGEKRQRGRVAVLNYSDAKKYEVVTWNLHVDKKYGKERKEVLISKFSKNTRLVIIEDIGADWIADLAKFLQIPVYVFALHWNHPHEHLLGNVQIPLGEDPRRHFILQYRQSLPFKVTKPERIDEQASLECTAERTMVRRIRALKDLQTEDIESAEQLVSYYCAKIGGNDIAVLLVDPCPNIREQFRNNATAAVPREPLPHAAIRSNDTEWDDWDNQEKSTDEFPDQSSLSVFDELITHFNTLNNNQELHPMGEAPYNWAAYCCSIVLGKNASTVQSSFVETWKLIGKASTGVKKLADFDFDKLERKAWSDDWKGEFFTQLWELREELELMQYRLEMNRQVISRLAAKSGVTAQSFYFQSSAWDAGNVTNINNHYYETDKQAGQTPKGKERGRQDDNSSEIRTSASFERELEEWDKLIRMNGYAIQLMNRTTETYVQAIGATATQFANEQTKNSKKLTGFAAVFVPASLCAAILAIPSFSPAEKITKFWVFWVVSVPLAIILAVLFLTDLPSWIKDKWKARPSQRSEDDIKEALEAGPRGGQIPRRETAASVESGFARRAVEARVRTSGTVELPRQSEVMELA